MRADAAFAVHVPTAAFLLMMVAMDQIHHLVSTMCEEEKLVKDMMQFAFSQIPVLQYRHCCLKYEEPYWGAIYYR